jgi:HK97 family phage prohead protease
MTVMLKAIQPLRNDSFNILKSDNLVIGGYASIEMVDKQNDLITLGALQGAVKKYMTIPKFRNVMTNHSNVQVGEVIPQYRDKGGKLWKTSVDDVGFFVVIKLREDIEKAKEVGREIRDGSLRSFSIGGQALEKKKKSHKEYGDYNEISKLELHEVTICEKGINAEAKFDILKQDKGETMTDIEKALNELNETLDRMETTNKEDLRDNFDKSTENNIKNIGKEESNLAEENTMSDVTKDDYMDTEEDEEIPTDEKLAQEEGEAVVEEEFTDEKLASKPDLATGQVEAGNAGEMVDDAHPQLDAKYMAKYSDQSTLDLSPENLEKAYAEFKAEQLEKMAYNSVKSEFENRFNTEMVSKTEEIEKSNYDAKAEVTELKKQFTNLLSSLTEDKTETIRKQEEAVAELDIPSGDEIAKMDWGEINSLVERLEGQI